MTMRLLDLADWVGGQLKGADAPVCGVGIDSRTLREGELFVALAGDRFDGHDFAAQCAPRAAGLLVARELAVDCPQILVEDPLRAMQQMAVQWRRLWPGRMAGITGSNGKTTTKEMTAAALGATGSVWASPGNLNNHIGVPLSLLGLRGEHHAAVIEMGANHPGEIRALARMAGAQAAAVTCAAEAHLEGFGDLQGVARAKAEIYEELDANGVAVINADDTFADSWQTSAAPRAIRTFSANPAREADVIAMLRPQARLEVRCGQDTMEIDWTIKGLHHARNAACAVTLALALGVPFKAAAEGLSGFELSAGGRQRFVNGLAGSCLIDDSYNANPGSFRASIDVLVAQGREPWMVMGEMGELGADSVRWHEEVAKYAREAGVRRLWALGAHAGNVARTFGSGGRACADLEQVADELRTQLGPDCVVLIKGSRAARLEMLVARLCQEEDPDAA